ncbi:hypothetical protein BDW02DRAFT_563605 [Decorospora gaudefroyi]|uniref:Polynucleotide 5'-hydroxyl-kinase GRC3 n=1 Tax=Decorospora gaudefroyi TaxID=184978 RepID=A0A6A5KTN7_9PLEO|nr:hypothetical protein BDW02DRAFT_563605 [Decorospora gaudefroyi]
MSGKRKRGEYARSDAIPTVTPLTAVAAARLKTEAATTVLNTPEVSLQSIPAASPLMESGASEQEESDAAEYHVPLPCNIKLCNWGNEAQNILSDTDSELTINLNKHATISLLGCFDFTVRRGAININGANIGTISRDGQKHRVHRAFVPATHAIFKLRGLDSTNHIVIRSCKAPAPLGHLNPLFTRLWNAKPQHWTSRSFCVVTDSNSDLLSRPLQPEVAPEDWLRAIEECANSPSITVITGCPSSGKSTFARRLVNRSLTGLGKNAPSVPTVCYLDLDMRKQEYAPSGQISLAVLRDLNLGPSFTHPSIPSGSGNSAANEIIRAHAIPMNLANYAEHYQACVEDLFLAYRNLCSSNASLPLVIDTPGFLWASDLNILNKLLVRLKPHKMVHIGDTQAIETETAAKLHLLQTTASQYRCTVHEITARRPQLAAMRTDAELKSMQMQSYFHLKTSSIHPSHGQTLRWTSNPLSHLTPWEFCYEETAMRAQDMVGFALYSEAIEPESLLHAVNGSIMQIVQTTSSVIPDPYTSLPRTGKCRIPYFPESERTGMVEPLDARTTRLVCTVMIRGFDPERKVVQVLVPKTHEPLLYGLLAERTVFVGGCCDMPEWAFVEDGYATAGISSSGSPASGAVRREMVWAERKDVIQGMGYLNTVRRVRKFQT